MAPQNLCGGVTSVLNENVPSIRDRLGLENAFAEFAPEPEFIDKQGWNSPHPFFAAIIKDIGPRLMIELGVWKAMSAIHRAKPLEKSEIGGEASAIDTWLGSTLVWCDKIGSAPTRIISATRWIRSLKQPKIWVILSR